MEVNSELGAAGLGLHNRSTGAMIMKVLNRAAKEAQLPADVPFAPLARRKGEQYGKAVQYVSDLQDEVSLLKTENATLTSDLTVAQGTIDRLRDEIEHTRKQATDRENNLLRDCQELQTLYVGVMSRLEVVGSIILSVIKDKKQPSHEESLRAVEDALLGNGKPPS